MQIDVKTLAPRLFLALVGFAAAITTLLGQFGEKNTVLIIAGIAVLIICLPVWYLLPKRRQFRSTELDEVSMRLADATDLNKIVALDKNAFNEKDLISVETFARWQEKNPYIFTCMLRKDTIVGYYAILPLVDEALHAFLTGRMREHDIKPRDILNPKEMLRSCKSLYVFSIVVKKRQPKLTWTLLSHLAETINDLIDRGCVQELYATDATEEGRRLIRRVRFELVQKDAERADGHNLYHLTVKSPLRISNYLNG